MFILNNFIKSILSKKNFLIIFVLVIIPIFLFFYIKKVQNKFSHIKVAQRKLLVDNNKKGKINKFNLYSNMNFHFLEDKNILEVEFINHKNLKKQKFDIFNKKIIEQVLFDGTIQIFDPITGFMTERLLPNGLYSKYKTKNGTLLFLYDINKYDMIPLDQIDSLSENDERLKYFKKSQELIIFNKPIIENYNAISNNIDIIIMNLYKNLENKEQTKSFKTKDLILYDLEYNEKKEDFEESNFFFDSLKKEEDEKEILEDILTDNNDVKDFKDIEKNKNKSKDTNIIDHQDKKKFRKNKSVFGIINNKNKNNIFIRKFSFINTKKPFLNLIINIPYIHSSIFLSHMLF